YRDSLLSSKERSLTNLGLRWITMALVVTLPWTKLRWALPFFSVLMTPPAVSEALGRRHKAIACIAQQMVMVVRRWLPEVSIKVRACVFSLPMLSIAFLRGIRLFLTFVVATLKVLFLCLRPH